VRTRFLCILAIVALMAVPALAASEKIGASGATITVAASPAEQAAAETFWTPARIAAAKPLPIPVDTGEPGADLATLARPTGPRGSSPGGAADPEAQLLAESAYWSDHQAFEDAPALTGGTSGVYDYYDVNTKSALWKVYPHMTVGRLVFSTGSGTAYCSATAISNNHIVTAGHCVYNTSTNVWYTNHVFVPAYRAGSAPYGSFAWNTKTILTAYVNLTGSYNIASWAKHDVAVLGMKTNSLGKTLNYMVGFAGRSWNYSPVQLVFNTGYPFRNYSNALLGSAGSYLRSCTAETAQAFSEVVRGGCYYGSGISGGPWFRVYRPLESGANNYVNAVNSGLYVGAPNLYAGRFNSNNIVALCNAEGC
jgi:V8-like Glu-specific endopeptidase